MEIVKSCIKNGLIFPEFEALYDKLLEIFYLLGEMSFLLLSNAELLPDGQRYFFSSQDIEVIMSVLYEHKDPAELQELQSIEAGD